MRSGTILIADDDRLVRESLHDLLADLGWTIEEAGNGTDAIAVLSRMRCDLLLSDVDMPDMTGFQLIQRIRKELGQTEVPIIIYTGRDLTKKQETELRRLADTIIVKDAQSPERLLDETTLFLHRVQANLPQA